MSKRSKRFLTFLLYAAIASNFGCTTTTYTSITPTKTSHVIEPSEAVMDVYHSAKFEKPPSKICNVFYRVLVGTTQYGNIARGDAPLFTITP